MISKPSHSSSLGIGRYLCVVILFSLGGGPALQARESRLLFAFEDVSVIPMDTERVLRHQTVVTEGDEIVVIGRLDSVRIPEEAVRIDGQGKYLMPGLADMHVHVWHAGEYLLFVRNGVTTVRVMAGDPLHFAIRKRILRGEVVGPGMYIAGPPINGAEPYWALAETSADARKIVAEQKAAGYDFLKIKSRLSASVLDAIVDDAEKSGLPVVGHAPLDIDFDHVLRSGIRSLEHLIGYEFALMSENAPDIKLPWEGGWVDGWVDAWRYMDETKLPDLVEKTRAAGVWNCPTLVTIVNSRVSPSELDAALRRPEVQAVSPRARKVWVETRKPDARRARVARETDRFRKRAVKALHDGGARLLLGTDTAQPFVVMGFSAHQELANFVDAGLSPYEAIRTGTADAAEFLGAKGQFGEVVEGQRADLVLVEANPLTDVENAGRISGVMLRGQWFSRAELDEMMASLIASYPENDGSMRR